MKLAGTHMAARQRTLWLVLLLAAVFCRSFIADGFMPEFHGGKTPRMAICYGGMDAGRSLPAHHDQKNPKAACPYMALASHTPVVPVVIADLMPEASPFQALLPARFTLSRYKTGISSRGPPSFS